MFSNEKIPTRGYFYSPDGNDSKEAPSEYKSLVSYLEKKYRVVSESFLDINGFIRGIYFQDSYMKDVFNFSPDHLCIDITYKNFETDIFMYLFLAEDANGRNDIVSLGFTVTEDSESLIWLLSTFKKHNPNWRRTKIVVIDSEIKQRDVIRNVFPKPYIIICFHHALKSFRKGLDAVNVQSILPIEQIQIALELFKSMYHVHRQAEFELYYQQFLLLHGSIVSYFQETWMPVQYQWRTGLDFYHENLFHSLNSYLEYLDNTFKSVYVAEDNILEFIRKSFLILTLKRSEKNNMTLYTNPLLFSQFSAERQISKVLTPYAAKFVIDQFDLSSEIHMDCSLVSDNYFFDNFGSPVNASASICSCHFFSYTFLPCRHIFAVRKTLSLCGFDEALIDCYWSMKYYQNTLTALQGSLCTVENASLETIASKSSSASHLLQLTLPTLLESPQPIFDSQIKTLNQLVSLWKNKKDVYLQFGGAEDKIACLKTDYYLENNFKKTVLPRVPPEVYKTESPSCPIYHNVSLEKENIFSNQTICEEEFKQSKWNFKSKILDGKHINYAYLCKIICESKESCLDWLRQMELIPIAMNCPSCNCEMVIKSAPRLSDGAIWICQNILDNKRNCSRRCSVRQGSWFELTNMTFEQILTFCYMWINGFSQNQIVSETGVSTPTYVTWNKLNGRVCEEILLEEGNVSIPATMNSSGCAQVSEMWLKSCDDEDSFLKFLQDANSVHRKDAIKLTS